MRITWIAALAGLVMLFLLVGVRPAGAETYDTTVFWTGASSIGPLGNTYRAMGQVFRAPAVENQLDTFCIYIGRTNPDVGPFTFFAYVMEWNGDDVAGDILYTSEMQSALDPSSTPFTFDTGGLVLTPDADYVLFADRGDSQPVPVQGAQIGCIHDDVFAPGRLVCGKVGDPFGELHPVPNNVSIDAAYTAYFSPEPATLSLLALGGLLLIRRRGA